jgi:hypothetical protein
MRTPRVRFTVRRMMLAVAVVAVLTPFPVEAVLAVLLSLAVWTPLVLIAGVVCDALRGRTGAEVFVVVFCIAVLCLLMPAYPPPHRDSDAFGLVLGLTPPNVVGPMYAALRVRRGKPLASGHVLWAWLGLAWSMLMLGWHTHARFETLFLMAQCSRLSLVFAVLLALYGARPAATGAAWAHHTGWVLMECDVIVWGWYAARFLR